MPANTVKVDRATVFGNPFSVGRSASVRMYTLWLEGKLPEGAVPGWAKTMGYENPRAYQIRHKPGF